MPLGSQAWEHIEGVRKRKLSETWHKLSQAPNEEAKARMLGRVHEAIVNDIWREIQPVSKEVILEAYKRNLHACKALANNPALDREGADYLFELTWERRFEIIGKQGIGSLWHRLTERFVTSRQDPWMKKMATTAGLQPGEPAGMPWQAMELARTCLLTCPDISIEEIIKIGKKTNPKEDMMMRIVKSPKMDHEALAAIISEWPAKDAVILWYLLMKEEDKDRPKWMDWMEPKWIADGLASISYGGQGAWTRVMGWLNTEEYPKVLSLLLGEAQGDARLSDRILISLQEAAPWQLALLDKEVSKALILSSNKELRELGVKVLGNQGRSR